MPAPKAFTPNVKQLQNLRIQQALSQRELARKAGLRPQTVNRMEKGLPTRMSTVQAIAVALGVQPLDIATVDA